MEMLSDLKKFEGLQLLREFDTTLSNSFSSKSQCFVQLKMLTENL